MSAPVHPRPGLIDPEVTAELPGLRLWELTAAADLRQRSKAAVRERLREQAGRITGGVAVQARSDEIVHAYRVCFRQVGLDPDVVRTPYEAALIERLRAGGLPARDRLADALLIALLDTKVAVLAFDDAALHGALRVSVRADGGVLAVADAREAIAPLFGPVASRCAPTAATSRLRLAAPAPAGVPALAVWEALASVGELVAPQPDVGGAAGRW